jgi:hypothetical protein
MEYTCPHCGEQLEGESGSPHLCADPDRPSTPGEEADWLNRPGTEGGANGGA